jgi:hypothetical protein
MAWGNFILDIGHTPAAAVTIVKFRVVKYTANPEEVTPVTAITDIMAGVAQFDVLPSEILRGKGSSDRVLGVSEVEASGAIGMGVYCTLETTGRVSAMVGASGKRIVGVCVGNPSTNAGDRISMLLVHGGGLA